MSAITTILDRLSGVAVLKAQVDAVSKNVDRSLTWMLDHEKRLLSLETKLTRPESAASKPRQLPKPPK